LILTSINLRATRCFRLFPLRVIQYTLHFAQQVVRERLKRTLPVAFADSVRAQIRAAASAAAASAGDLLDINFRKKEKLGEGAQRAIAAAPAASGASPSLQVLVMRVCISSSEIL
jgi:hypothetical protein